MRFDLRQFQINFWEAQARIISTQIASRFCWRSLPIGYQPFYAACGFRPAWAWRPSIMFAAGAYAGALVIAARACAAVPPARWPGGLVIVARVAQLSRRAFLFSPGLAIGGSGQTASCTVSQKEPPCGVLLQSKNPPLGPARRILSDAVHRRPYRRF
jgi:hypothetical protein